MAKDFRKNISGIRENKQSQNYAEENKMLKEKLEHSKDMIRQIQAEKTDNTEIHISKIKLSTNIRKDYTYEYIKQFALSIKHNGQLQAVTLTSDGYLVSGHRRYKAIEHLVNIKEHSGLIKVIYLDKTFKELEKEKFDKYQFEENEQRKNLDNFQLAELFLKYSKEGYTHERIGKLFGKTKTVVSEILRVLHVNPKVRELLKEIQYYGMSKSMFEEKKLYDFNLTPTIIGIKTFRKILQDGEVRQIHNFVELFKPKLTQKDLDYLEYKPITPILGRDTNIYKFKQKLEKNFKSFEKDYKDEESRKIIKEAEKHLKKFEKELSKLKPK